MKKITSLFIMMLLMSLVMFNGKQVKADEPVENGNVSVTTVLPDDNTITHTFNAEGTFSPTQESEDHDFVYHVVNGKVYDEVPVNGFKFHTGMEIISVFTSGEKKAALFLDTNGKFLGVNYVTDEIPTPPSTANLSKPGFTVSDSPFGTLETIAEHTIYFVNYKENETPTTVTINENEYNLNDVVTLTNETPVTWLEHNIPVWYGTEYSFTALSDREITKKDDGVAPTTAYVSSIKHLDLRGDGSLSHLGQVYIPDDLELIEVGYLLHTDNNLELTMDTPDVTILRSNSVNEFRNEFLRTVSSENVMNTNVRAYAVVSDGNERTIVYEEIRTSVIFNLNNIDWNNEIHANSLKMKYYGDISKNVYVDFIQIGNTKVYQAFIDENDRSQIDGFELYFYQDSGEKKSNWIVHTPEANKNTEVYYVESWINNKWSATLNLDTVKTLSFHGGQISVWEPKPYWLRVALFDINNNQFDVYNWQGFGVSGDDNEVKGEPYTLELIEELGVESVEIWFTQWMEKEDVRGHKHMGSYLITWNQIGNITYNGWGTNNWDDLTDERWHYNTDATP